MNHEKDIHENGCFVDKTSNLAALSIKRADFMDTVRILRCAVHGNEAFDGQRALCRWNCSRFLEHSLRT